MPPPLKIAQVMLWSETIFTTPVMAFPVPSTTLTGVLLLVVVLLPSCPWSLYPQHLTEPFEAISAQLIVVPLVMSETPVVRPVTSYG
jgi:hypothetical protein